EDVRSLQSEYFGAMAAETRAEGGTIEKLAGGAVMAVFGVPAAREDDAVRAVRAARGMLEHLEPWDLDRRIGGNTGDVLAAAALVTGEPGTGAARLQQAAEPGTIAVGDRTARAARSHFTFRELGAGTWTVEGERETAAPRSPPGLAAPLVGRSRELDALRTA